MSQIKPLTAATYVLEKSIVSVGYFLIWVLTFKSTILYSPICIKEDKSADCYIYYCFYSSQYKILPEIVCSLLMIYDKISRKNGHMKGLLRILKNRKLRFIKMWTSNIMFSSRCNEQCSCGRCTRDKHSRKIKRNIYN